MQLGFKKLRERKKEVAVFWKFPICFNRCMKPEIINIPYALMKRCKRDKVSFEMLACASLIKEVHSNSVLYLEVRNVIKVFKVSFRKAKKLIEQMKQSDLFIYNHKKNCVYAKTFKSGSWKIFRCGKKGKPMKAFFDRCYKMPVREDDNLRTRKEQLRSALMVVFISAKWNHFNVTNSSMEQSAKEQALTYRTLGNAIGMSKSSGRRYSNKLIDQKRVSKSGIVAERVINVLNEETEADWRRRNPNKNFFALHDAQNGGWSGWVFYGSVYSLESQDDFKAMQRVVWNHRDRLSESEYYDDDQSCSGYYGKMEHSKISKKHYVYA